MINEILSKIREETSGSLSKKYIEELVKFHRIQVSPGIRRAAEYIYSLLNEWGLKTEILSFPAREDVSFWSKKLFQEWDISEGVLFLLKKGRKEKIADYNEMSLSVIPRSISFEGKARVVVLNNGEEDREYKGMDLRNKIVLTKGDIRRVRELAVEKYGALGIIYDGMKELKPVRQRMDLPDALSYTSFWWKGEEKKCFGFIVSPRTGEELRKMKNPEVYAKIVSSLYNGEMEVVTAEIPGKIPEEVVIVAHFCHPLPSANDNASGVSSALESARVLKKNIDRGVLKKPMRRIRFLFVPEMTGTYAYLASNEDNIKNIVSAINLDMVGEDQEKCESSLLLVKSPDSNPSFADSLLREIIDKLSKDAKGFDGRGEYPLFRFAEVPFMAGSDHYIFQDPSVGIPCPMLNQWPDKFYHTSFDSPDKVSPDMLKRASIIASVYAYFIATAGPKQMKWLSYVMLNNFKREIVEDNKRLLGEILEAKKSEIYQKIRYLKKRIKYKEEIYKKALSTLRRFGVVGHSLEKDLKDFLWKESRKTENSIKEITGIHINVSREKGEDRKEREASRMIPHRVYRGPPDIPSYLGNLSKRDRRRWYKLQKKLRNMWTIGILALYWSDGKRTLLDIADKVYLETGKKDLVLLKEYFDLLSKMGLVNLRLVD